MAPEESQNYGAGIWRSQQVPGSAVTLADVHQRAHRFESQVRWRNRREHVAAVFVVVFFGVVFFATPSWMIKAGSALLIIATIFVSWWLHHHGTAKPSTLNASVPLLEAHREELVRQRNLLRSVPAWYLAPFLPGLLLVLMGRYFQAPVPGRSAAWDHQIILMSGAVMALVFIIVWVLNAWGAERLQRRIDELEGLRQGPP